MANTTGKKFGGRQKGSHNRTTKEIREAYQRLVENKLEDFDSWLQKVADSDPARALEIVVKISEYFIPKLNRSVDEDNKDTKIEFIIRKD